jgi:hypothetical protein
VDPNDIIVELDGDSDFIVSDITAEAKRCYVTQAIHVKNMASMSEMKEKMIELGVYEEYSKGIPSYPRRLRYRVTSAKDPAGAKNKEMSFNRKASEIFKREKYLWTEKQCDTMKSYLLKYNDI